MGNHRCVLWIELHAPGGRGRSRVFWKRVVTSRTGNTQPGAELIGKKDAYRSLGPSLLSSGRRFVQSAGISAEGRETGGAKREKKETSSSRRRRRRACTGTGCVASPAPTPLPEACSESSAKFALSTSSGRTRRISPCNRMYCRKFNNTICQWGARSTN